MIKSLNEMDLREKRKQQIIGIFSSIFSALSVPFLIILIAVKCLMRIFWNISFSDKKIEKIIRKNIYLELKRNSSDGYAIYSRTAGGQCWINGQWRFYTTYSDSSYFRATDKGHYWLSKAGTDKIEKIIKSIRFDDVCFKEVASSKLFEGTTIDVVVFSINPVYSTIYQSEEKMFGD